MNLRAKEVLLNLTDQHKRIQQGTNVAVCNTAECVLVEDVCTCEVKEGSFKAFDVDAYSVCSKNTSDSSAMHTIEIVGVAGTEESRKESVSSKTRCSL